MAQLNINMTPEFAEDLQRLMRLRRIRTKSEALRTAVREAVDAAELDNNGPVDFQEWIGLGNTAKRNPNPRFTSTDELWEK